MLYFVTSNKQKIRRIKPTLESFGIQTEVKEIEVEEIQSDSIEDIAMHKAKYAFQTFSSPLFVVDDGWFITALNGFPGAYMKKVNTTLSSEDILNLMSDHTNREFTFQQVVAYTDGKMIETFSFKKTGEVMRESRGSGMPPSNSVLSFGNDLSIAELAAKNIRMIDDEAFWKEFAEWLKNRD